MHIWCDVITNKYKDFNTRATRKEYWTFSFINFSVILVLVLLSPLYGTSVFADILRFVPIIYALFIFIPTLAAMSRRLHDIGKTSNWLLLLISTFGILFLLLLLTLKSEPFSNQYGPVPK